MKFNPNKEIVTRNPEETFNIGFELGKTISPPFLIGLNGELGTGKTVFTKGIAKALGVEELITSPTFLGVSECYSGKYPFIHMDFFMKVVDKNKVDFYLKKDSIVIIEWIKNYELVFYEKLITNLNVQIEYIFNKVSQNENERHLILDFLS